MKGVRERPIQFTSPGVLPILVLATSLCLLFLGRKSFDLDEVFSILIARLDWAPFWRLLREGEANMVFYYLLLRFWLAFGVNEATVRFLSVLPALATLPLVYALGRRLFGTRVGLIAGVLLAMNTFYISYAQFARSYSLLLFLVTLSSLLYAECLDRPSPRRWVEYVISSTLAVYTHLFAVLVIAAHWAFPIVFMRRRVFPWKSMATSALVLGLLTLPMGIFALTQNHGQISWIPRLSFYSAYPLLSVTGALTGAGIDREGTRLLALVYLLLVVLGVVAMRRAWSSNRASAEFWHYGFILTWLTLPVLLAVGISVAIQPIVLDRYFIVILPPLVLVVSIGLSQLRRKLLLWGALGLVLALSVRSLYFYYSEFQRDDWRTVTRFITSHAYAHDALLFYAPYTRRPYEYYATRLNAAVRPVIVYPPGNTYPPGASSEIAPTFSAGAFGGYSRVWLVLSHNTLGRYASGPLIMASLSHEFRLTESKTFSDILVLLYSRETCAEARCD